MVKIQTNQPARLFTEVTAPQNAVKASLTISLKKPTSFKNLMVTEDSVLYPFYSGYTLLTKSDLFTNYNEVLVRPIEDIADESTARITYDYYSVDDKGNETLIHDNVTFTQLINLSDFYHMKIVANFYRSNVNDKCNLIRIDIEPNITRTIGE